jgi:hypothetical protein
LRNDVLHDPKATNPRAAVATAANTPITFNALTNNPYQPLTSHLRTESGSGFRLVDGTNSTCFHCKYRDDVAGWFARGKGCLWLIRPFQNEIMLTE